MGGGGKGKAWLVPVSALHIVLAGKAAVAKRAHQWDPHVSLRSVHIHLAKLASYLHALSYVNLQRKAFRMKFWRQKNSVEGEAQGYSGSEFLLHKPKGLQ